VKNGKGGDEKATKAMVFSQEKYGYVGFGTDISKQNIRKF